MSTPGTTAPATRNASANAEEKSGFRTKTVATRITPEELREVESAAERDGKTLAEWLRDLALKAARQRAADPMELLLSEQSATRYMLLNLFHATAQANAEGKHLLAESVLRIRGQADARKLADARKDDRKFSGPGCPGGARRGPAVSRPMRFPSRGGRVLLLLFGITLGPFLLVLPASAWLAWTLTPLQKFYLGTYTASSIGATQPRNVTSIRWVLKTAPGRKSVSMLPQDAVAGPNRKLPVNLSARAIGDGWRGVALSSPEKVRSSELAPLLRDSMYDGDSVPRILGMPLLYGLVGLIFVCLALQKAKDAWGYGLSSWAQRRHEERHGRRTKGPELSLPSSLKMFRQDGIRLRLQGESIGSKLVPWGRSYAIPKRLESSHIMLCPHHDSTSTGWSPPA